MRAGLVIIFTVGAVLCMTAQPGSARAFAGNHIAEMAQSSECTVPLHSFLYTPVLGALAIYTLFC